MIALAWFAGCTSKFPEELLGVRVTEAHLEGVAGGTMMMIGGGWTGGGDLVATTSRGDEVRVPVDLSAGSVGLLFDMSWSPPSKMRFGLPEPEIPAGDLFGRYKGSRESLVLVLGASAFHLENERHVRIDDVAFTLGVGLEVGWTWLNVTMHELEPEHTGGTGETGDTGAATLPDDTSPPTDTGTP